MTSHSSSVGRHITGIALGALLFVGAGCAFWQKASVDIGANQPAPAGAGTNVNAAANVNAGASAGTNVNAAANVNVNASGTVVADVKTFVIVAKSWTFSPAEIRVKQGDKVRLEVSASDTDHGLAIPAFNVNLKFGPGQPATAEFVADEKGTYPFFCSVFCGSGHKDMKGTLIVE